MFARVSGPHSGELLVCYTTALADNAPLVVVDVSGC